MMVVGYIALVKLPYLVVIIVGMFESHLPFKYDRMVCDFRIWVVELNKFEYILTVGLNLNT